MEINIDPCRFCALPRVRLPNPQADATCRVTAVIDQKIIYSLSNTSTEIPVLLVTSPLTKKYASMIRQYREGIVPSAVFVPDERTDEIIGTLID